MGILRACIVSTFALAASSQAHSETPANADTTRPVVGIIKGVMRDGVFHQIAPAQTRDKLKLNPAGAAENYDYRIHDTITRYQTTGIYGLTEYYPDTCQQVSAGAWTLQHDEKYGIATTTTTSGPLAGGACPGHTFTFATVFYRWDERSNKTQDPYVEGPTDIFNGTWKTPDGKFNLAFEYDISVNIVRPKGERNVFEGWKGAYSRWRVTLIPPDDDPGFDFTDEKIKETYVSDNDSCPVIAPNMANSTVVKNGPPGNFGDSVGYDACIIEYSRFVKRTPCGFNIRQKMEISAPNDQGKFNQYSMNTLGSTITGSIIYGPGQLGIGQVSAQRVTPFSAPPPATRGFTTTRTDCLTSLIGLQLLLHMN